MSKNINGLFYGRQTPNKYGIEKEKARNEAINYQIFASDTSLSYTKLADASERFYRLGKRYGLIREFKENGII